jgi:hypothetical protein
MDSVPLLKHILGEEFPFYMSNSIMNRDVIYPLWYKSPRRNGNEYIFREINDYLKRDLVHQPLDGQDMQEYVNQNGAVVLYIQDSDEFLDDPDKTKSLARYIKDKTYAWFYDLHGYVCIIISLPKVVNGNSIDYGTPDNYIYLLKTLRDICRVCNQFAIYEKTLINYHESFKNNVVTTKRKR